MRCEIVTFLSGCREIEEQHVIHSLQGKAFTSTFHVIACWKPSEMQKSHGFNQLWCLQEDMFYSSLCKCWLPKAAAPGWDHSHLPHLSLVSYSQTVQKYIIQSFAQSLFMGILKVALKIQDLTYCLLQVLLHVIFISFQSVCTQVSWIAQKCYSLQYTSGTD